MKHMGNNVWGCIVPVPLPVSYSQTSKLENSEKKKKSIQSLWPESSQRWLKYLDELYILVLTTSVSFPQWVLTMYVVFCPRNFSLHGQSIPFPINTGPTHTHPPSLAQAPSKPQSASSSSGGGSWVEPSYKFLLCHKSQMMDKVCSLLGHPCRVLST